VKYETQTNKKPHKPPNYTKIKIETQL